MATRPIADFDAYRQQLSQFVFKSGLIMRPVFEQARRTPKRVIFSAGEDDRVLRAVQIVLDEGCRPTDPDRPARDRAATCRASRPAVSGPASTQLVDPSNDPRYDRYWSAYHQLMERRGVTEPTARNLVRSSPTLIAALAVRMGDADAMIAGAYGRFRTHFNHVRDVIGTREGVKNMAALSLLVMPTKSLFIADTYVNDDPDARDAGQHHLVGGRRSAALWHPAQGGTVVAFELRQLRSSLGAQDGPGGEDAARARADPRVDGEMHGDAALDPDIRNSVFPRSRLRVPPTWWSARRLTPPTLDSTC